MTWLAFVHSRGGTSSLVSKSLLRFALICVVAVVALLPLSGCAARVVTHFGPTLDSPYVTHVCVRQPKVPENQRFWGVTDSGKLVLEDWELALYQEHGRSIFYFDPEAPPESAGRLPIPYHKLECPERILSKAPLLPRKPAVVAKKPEKEEKNETKEPEAKAAKAEAKPPPPQPSATPPQRTEEHRPRRQEPRRVASKGCEGFSESGQKRLRGKTTRTCVRTRLLINRGVEEDPPPQAMVALKPPEPEPVPQKPAEYADWGLTEPDTSGLDLDRVKECLGGVCHARHKNFKPKGKKPGEAGYAKTGAGEGGAPPTKTRTTVKTRKSPLSRPAKTGAPTNEKKVPNPNGRKGGQAHQDKVREVKADIKKRGLESKTEQRVETPGGHKENRYVDVAGLDPNTKKPVEFHQVGKQTKKGQPVSREVKALDDVEGAKGQRPTFHPYNKVK